MLFKQCTRLIQKHFNVNSRHQLNKKSTFLFPNLKILQRVKERKFCTTSYNNMRHFADVENKFAYNIVQTLYVPKTNRETIKTDASDSFFDQNWRSAQASEIVLAFQSVLSYCIANNVDLSDNRFDKLVDGLMDNVEKLTSEELIALLDCLRQFPPTPSISSHNFDDIWNALDDMCCLKMRYWDIATTFEIADLWYKLNLGTICKYVNDVTYRLGNKPGRLTKDQLVHAFFLMNVCRKPAVNFEYQTAVAKKINDMSVDEIAIVAMGFFKTKSKIKLVPILSHMIGQVKSDCHTIHEISLAAILKIIRMSAPLRLTEQIVELLDELTPQINRLSNLCCLHIALLGTTLQICHEKSLTLVIQKLLADVEAVRLKDVERLLLAATMFDIELKMDPDIFQTAYRELHSVKRLPEKVLYSRCLCSALSHLSMKNIYSYELMNEVLDKEFITEKFGRSSKDLPRELFVLDRSAEIECPDYKGNRLELYMRYKASKWLTEFTPSYEQHKKLTAADRLILDVIDLAHKIVGDRKYLLVEHILPHYSKADIVLCVDKKTKAFVEPAGFENYVLGDVMRPWNVEDFAWYAIVIVGWNMTTRNTTKPLGMVKMKERQLRTIGYEPILIIWNEFSLFQTEEKIDYILSKIKHS